MNSTRNLEIRPALESDFEAIWAIFSEITQAGDTYTNSASTTREEAYHKWLNPKADSFVAAIDGEIAGAYLVIENRPGHGSHVANASFIVNSRFRGNGIGRALGEHAISTAKQKGFLAMQFNFVVSTNSVAVHLWKSLGFAVIGTIPKGFNHKTLGYVDAYIMHRFL